MADSEIVDVVDDADEVVGHATRAEMRAGNLRHRAAYVLVFDPAGRLFVHRRSAGKDVYPSYYDVAVGGVLGAGESYDEGAERELGEELGVKGASLRPILSFRYEDEHSRVNGRVYSCRWDGPLSLQAEEIESGEWLDLDEVIERAGRDPFCPDGIEALLLYLDRLARVSAD